MAISAPFNTVGEADSAYYGDDSDGGGNDGSAAWNDVQRAEVLEAGWVLAYQDEKNGDARRWFVIRTNESGTLQAVNPNGETYSRSGNEPLDAMPHYDTEEAAREAYNEWLNRNGGGGTGDGSAWGAWNMAREEPPWFIFTRSHTERDDQQFLAAGQNSEGEEVYLQPDGTAGTTAHIYDSSGALTDAISAYRERASNGNTGPNAPTGAAPSAEDVREDAAGATRGVRGVVDRLGGPWVVLGLLIAAGGAAWYADQQGWIDLPDEVTSIPDDVVDAIPGGDA